MPIGPVILVDFLYFCIFDPLKHVFSEKKPGGTKWKKWQHGFLCSQYYLGYFKCILQDYSKKYYNISFPYINRWTTTPTYSLRQICIGLNSTDIGRYRYDGEKNRHHSQASSAQEILLHQYRILHKKQMSRGKAFMQNQLILYVNTSRYTVK